MLDWLSPQKIETINSEINGEITVYKDQGKIKVYVDGTQQSGPWVKKIWSKVNLTGENILLLGLGCGIGAESLAKNNPTGKITGVEIDPQMVSIGKKYFKLSKIPNLTIIELDALKFLETNTKRFDLILIDIYLGKSYPELFESQKFLQKLSQTMSNEGRVIFNRLTTKTTNFEREKFVDNLEKYLKIQEITKVDFNTLIICSRR